MALTLRQRLDRLRKRLIELDQWTVRRRVAVDGWTFNGAPIDQNQPWPTRDGVVTLSCPSTRVPDDWPLKDTRLDLNLGGEGLARLAYDDGGHAAFALDPNHGRFHLEGRSFSIGAECVARLPFGVPNRDARLQEAALVWLDVGLADFVLLMRQVGEAVEALGDYETADPMLSAAEDAFAMLDWPSATQNYLARVQSTAEQQRIWQLPEGLPADPDGLGADARASVAAAAQALTAALKALTQRYPQQGGLAVTGHAHIDLAWLWPLEETRRKANRTFHTVVGLMKRYPDFRFNQSTAQLYAFLEEDDPALFADIRERAAAGQWEPIGAMWVEPDTNMPTGESFVRQLLYGQRYFERTFGRRHTVCWLPDCFGFSPALPQLLRAGRGGQLLHHQGQLVGDQPLPLRPLLVGGTRWQPRACPHLPEPRRRLQRRSRPARGGRDLAQLPWQDQSARKPALLRLWRRRRRADRGDDRAPAPHGRLPGDPVRPPGRGRRMVRVAARSAWRQRPAELGRRDLSRTASRYADHAGPHQVPAPARRARADRRRDAVEHGRDFGGAAGAVAGGALADHPAQRVPRHPAGIEHPRGL